MPQPKVDGRRFRRVPVAIRVFARERSVFPVDTRDVSHGGFSVCTDEPLPAGTRSAFALALPHHEVPLEIHGEVVWAQGDGMGVRLTHADERYSEYVDR